MSYLPKFKASTLEKTKRVLDWVKSKRPADAYGNPQRSGFTFFEQLSSRFQYDVSKNEWETFWLPLQIERHERIMNAYHKGTELGAEFDSAFTPDALLYCMLGGKEKGKEIPVEVVHLLMSCWIPPTMEYKYRHDMSIEEEVGGFFSEENSGEEWEPYNENDTDNRNESKPEKKDEEAAPDAGTTNTAPETESKDDASSNVYEFAPECLVNVPEYWENPDGTITTEKGTWKFDLETFVYLNELTSKILFYCIKRHLYGVYEVTSRKFASALFTFFRCLVKLTLKFNFPIMDNKTFSEYQDLSDNDPNEFDPYDYCEYRWLEIEHVGMFWEDSGAITYAYNREYYLPTLLTFLVRNLEFFYFKNVRQGSIAQLLDVAMFFNPSEKVDRSPFKVETDPVTGNDYPVPFPYDPYASASLLYGFTNSRTVRASKVLDKLIVVEPSPIPLEKSYWGRDKGGAYVRNGQDARLVCPEYINEYAITIVNQLAAYLEIWNKWYKNNRVEFTETHPGYKENEIEDTSLRLPNRLTMWEQMINSYESCVAYVWSEPKQVTAEEFNAKFTKGIVRGGRVVKRRKHEEELNFRDMVGRYSEDYTMRMAKYGFTKPFGLFVSTHVTKFVSVYPHGADDWIVAVPDPKREEPPKFLEEAIKPEGNTNVKAITTMLVECSSCGKKEEKKRALKTCSKCKKVYYCGVKCQKKHWGVHSSVCS